MIPKETEEQIQLATRLRYKNYIFSKIASETYTTSWDQKRKNKLEWVNKWVPDTIILLKNKNALVFIELKRQKKVLKNWDLSSSNSKVSEEQTKWIENLNKIENIGAYVCYGADEAITLIEKIEND